MNIKKNKKQRKNQRRLPLNKQKWSKFFKLDSQLEKNHFKKTLKVNNDNSQILKKCWANAIGSISLPYGILQVQSNLLGQAFCLGSSLKFLFVEFKD